MATNRKYRKRAALIGQIDTVTKRHLLVGDCLLNDCLICSPYWHPPAPRRLSDDAEEIWKRNRDALLQQWYATDATDWCRWDEKYGFGKYGLPCFGEVFFDDVPLPLPDREWPEAVIKIRHQIGWHCVYSDPNYSGRPKDYACECETCQAPKP